MDPSLIIALASLVLAIIGTIAIWRDARKQLRSWAKTARRSTFTPLHRVGVRKLNAIDPISEFPDLASDMARSFLKLNPSLQGNPAIDDCIVLVHSPGYRGWDPDDIHLKFNDQVIKRVRGNHDEYVQKKKDTFSGDNRTKYCLLSYTQPLLDASGNTLALELGYTDFRTSSSVYELLDEQLPVLSDNTVFDRFAPNLIKHVGGVTFEVGSDVIPVIPCVDLTVVGSDDKIVLLRRSESVHFFPGTWTATIEEQMKAPWAGQKGDKSIREAAIRSIEEELLGDLVHMVEIGSLKLLAMLLNPVVFSADLVGIAYVNLPAEDIAKNHLHRATDPYEHGQEYQTVDFSMGAVLSLISNQNLNWHSIARMRLILALMWRYGFDAVAKHPKFQELASKS